MKLRVYFMWHRRVLYQGKPECPRSEQEHERREWAVNLKLSIELIGITTSLQHEIYANKSIHSLISSLLVDSYILFCFLFYHFAISLHNSNIVSLHANQPGMMRLLNMQNLHLAIFHLNSTWTAVRYVIKRFRWVWSWNNSLLFGSFCCSLICYQKISISS